MKTIPLLIAALGFAVTGVTARAQTVVSIIATDDQAAETRPGQTPNPGLVRVSRTGGTATALVVWIKVSGTATRNADYVFGSPVGASVTIPAGSAHLDISIHALDDGATEVGEDIRVELEDETANSLPVPYDIGANDRAEMDLLDNDSLPPPAIVSVAGVSPAAEGTPGAPVAGVFRFSRSGDTSAAVTVAYAVEGSATSGADFTALSGSVLIPAGATFAEVIVQPVDDGELEGDESVSITLLPSTCASAHPLPASCYAFGESTTAEVNIEDNEIPPVRAVVDVAALSDAAENSGGSPVAGAFRFTRSVNLDVALTVAYTVGGTATAPADYAALSGSVTIPAGVATVDVVVSPVDDRRVEPLESVMLTISPSTCPERHPPAECYLVGASGSATVAITSDDVPPVVAMTVAQNTNFVGLPAVGQGTLSAHSTSGYIAAYQVRVDGVQQFHREIDHITPPAPGTPFTADFALTNLPAGARNVQVTVWDNYWNGTVVTHSLTITNIPMPSVFEAVAIDADAAETLPGEPPDTGRIRFTMTGNLNIGIWDWGFGGTARINSDYILTWEGGTLTTNGNVLTWTTEAVVTPMDDHFVENTETVDLQACFVIIAWIYGVGAPIGTECSSLGAIVHIRDNDTISPHPVVRVTAGDADAQEVSPLSGDAANPGAFTISRTALPTNDLPVHYTLSGSARNGTDYSTITGTTILPTGAASAMITVQPLFDHVAEGDERVTLTLQPAVTGPTYLLDPGVANHASVVIRDYAPANIPVIRIKVTDSMAFEMPSTSPHAVFRFERTGGLASEFALPYTVSGTAVNGIDYVRLPEVANFPAGVSHSIITVIPFLDGETNEPDETIVLTLPPPPADLFPPPYLLGGPEPVVASAGATLREDAPPLIRPVLDRFERARRRRFPSRYRIVPLPIVALPTLPEAGPAPVAPLKTWAVEASSDLATWQEIGTTEDPEEFVDVDAGDAPQRFYRFREVPPSAP